METAKVMKWLDEQVKIFNQSKKKQELSESGYEFISNISTKAIDGVHISPIENLIGVIPNTFKFEKFECDESYLTKISFIHKGVKFYGLSEEEVEYFV